MIKLDIRADFDPLLRQLETLRRDLRDKVIARALNKVGDQTKTMAKREIAAEWRMPQKDINAKLSVKRASWRNGHLEVAVVASSPRGRSLNVVRFMAVGSVKGNTFKARGYKANKGDIAGLKGQLGFQFRQVGGIKQIKGAFIGNRGRTVFIRTGPGRLPIKPVQVIDVPSMFNTKRLNALLVQNVKARFPQIFDQEFAAVMRGF